MAHKSFRYKAKTTWTSERLGVLSGTGKPDIIVGSPPEFKGKPDNWAPEELLVGSVNTCILLTFLTLAQGRGLIPAAYESEADGLLENVDGKFLMTEVTVRPRITVKSQVDVEPIREAIRERRIPLFHVEFRKGEGDGHPRGGHSERSNDAQMILTDPDRFTAPDFAGR